MSTLNLYFRREIRKYINSFLLKKRLIWSCDVRYSRMACVIFSRMTRQQSGSKVTTKKPQSLPADSMQPDCVRLHGSEVWGFGKSAETESVHLHSFVKKSFSSETINPKLFRIWRIRKN